MSVPEITRESPGDCDVLRRTLFAQVPDELMGWLEGEMQNRRPDGQPPISKNVVVAEALTVYRTVAMLASGRQVGAPLSKEEVSRLIGILDMLAQPIRLDRSRKTRASTSRKPKEGQ